MNEDPHDRFLTWLLDGAQGDPPRDLALHASLCQACMDWVGAHDALTRMTMRKLDEQSAHPCEQLTHAFPAGNHVLRIAQLEARVLLRIVALALHPADEGVPWHTASTNVIDCGRRPGYLHDRLTALREVALHAQSSRRRVDWC